MIIAEEYDDDMTSSWNTGPHFASAYIKMSVCPSHKVNTSTIFEDFSAVSQDFLRKNFHRSFMQKVSVLKTYLLKWHYQISFENVSAFP